MKENEIIYGNDNREYLIKKVEDNKIEVEYNRKILVIKNAYLEENEEVHKENILFDFSEIGKNIFLKLNDCYKTATELLNDVDYICYKENINERIKLEEVKEKEKLEEIQKMAPKIKMSDKQKDIRLIQYEDKEFSKKEEERFYQKETATYFARMDLETEYYNQRYFGGKYYISKDTIQENSDSGIFGKYGEYYTADELRQLNLKSMIKPNTIVKGINKQYADGTNLIHWTSPLANLYYDKTNNSLEQWKYNYKAMLKRTFSFNPLNYVNTYIMNNSFYTEGTVDEFLLEVLKEKRDSDELTDIIYTIQSNQNKIIRTNKSENFIVQGCAGSGKTMILLHRMSYLKFNNMLPSYDKIKIITPNRLFSEFISNLSNDLDISEIEQITISNYYFKLNNRYLEMYNKFDSIKEYIKNKKEKYKRKFLAEKMIDENELLKDIVNDLYSEELFKYIKEIYDKLIMEEIKKVDKLDIVIADLNEKNIKTFERFIYKSEKVIEEKTKQLEKILDDLRYEKEKGRTFMGGIQMFTSMTNNKMKQYEEKINYLNEQKEKIENRILEIRKVKNELLENGYFVIDLYDKILNKIEEKFNFQFKNGNFTRIELLILLYINYLHFGELQNKDELLCIDEAQDYNIIEYKVLKIVNKEAIMNLYGDINQSFYFKGIKNWEQLEKDMKFKRYELNENYRNSIQITEFCNKKFEFNTISMGLNGKEVQYIDYNYLQNIIDKKIKEKKKVAIIVSDNEILENIKNKYVNEHIIYLTVSNAKGIEYDTVIVIEDKMSNNEKYISYTRALNELYILNQ